MEHGLWSLCDQVILQSSSENSIVCPPPPSAIWQKLAKNGIFPDPTKTKEVGREDRVSECLKLLYDCVRSCLIIRKIEH